VTHKQRRAARLKAQAEAREVEMPRPLRPADCYRSAAGTSPCVRCGKRTRVMHRPLRGESGPFCDFCCSCCAPAASGSRAEPGGVFPPSPYRVTG
jgi:hypothetical protein